MLYDSLPVNFCEPGMKTPDSCRMCCCLLAAVLKGQSEPMMMLQLVTAGEQACRCALRSLVESFFL